MPESVNTPEHERGIEAFRERLFVWHPSLHDILDDTALDEAIAAYLRERTDLVERPALAAEMVRWLQGRTGAFAFG